MLKKRRRKPKKEFVPTPAMEEMEAFSERRDVAIPLPDICVELLCEALDTFEVEPELRDRGQGAGGQWADGIHLTLLGFVAVMTGFELEGHDNPLYDLRQHLLGLGFTVYDQLCLQEINGHSIKTDVLRERVDRFIETGERMPFVDDLHEYNVGRLD